MNWLQNLLFGKELKKLEDRVMSTIAEVQEAVANEANEVKARVDELELRVQTLEDQIANGEHVTREQLAELKLQVQNIFTPRDQTA